MTNNNCELIRQQLDDLMLNQACSPEVAAHLQECSECREFHQTQTKLRQMVGSLGTVAAPPDFDFRLRARLANERNTAFHFTSAYWPFARRAFAVAGVMIFLATGIVVLRNVLNREPVNVTATDRANQNSPVPAATVIPNVEEKSVELRAEVSEPSPQKTKGDRPSPAGPRIKRGLAAVDFSSERAEVINRFDVVDTSGATPVFPIDASLQSLKVSLDDGHGNARTISVPTIRFGSQRMLPKGNQFASKDIW